MAPISEIVKSVEGAAVRGIEREVMGQSARALKETAAHGLDPSITGAIDAARAAGADIASHGGKNYKVPKTKRPEFTPLTSGMDRIGNIPSVKARRTTAKVAHARAAEGVKERTGNLSSALTPPASSRASIFTA